MNTILNNNGYLSRIARHLIINSSYTDNLGLYNGKMGILIFFAHFARYTQKKIYDDFAGKLLDEVYSEIHTETPINFTNGLCGIGWSMEYLLQNNFLDGNSNEVLVMPSCLESWHQIAQKEYVQQTDLGHFCRLFLQWINHEDIKFTSRTNRRRRNTYRINPTKRLLLPLG